MDATDKMATRIYEWFRDHAPADGVRIYDDKDGVTIGVDGHISICKLVTFLMHGNVTHTPGPAPELTGAEVSHHELVQAALQNLPDSMVNNKVPEEKVP